MDKQYAATEDAYENMYAIMEVLRADLERCYADLSGNLTDQFARRSFVRGGFVAMEGAVHALKMLTVKVVGDSGRNPFEERDWEVLTDSKIKGKGGSTERKTSFAPLVESIEVAFRCYAHFYDLAFELDKSAEGWRSLNDLKDVRNKITHPKAAADFNISDEVVENAANMLTWFSAELNRLMQTMVKTKTKSPSAPPLPRKPAPRTARAAKGAIEFRPLRRSPSP